MGSISMSHVEKKKGSILWVVFEKGVQFCELFSKKSILGVIFKKKGWVLWVIFQKEGSILWVVLKKKVQFCESYYWKVQFVESCEKKGFNSFNHIGKRFNSVGHIQEKGSIHWDILKKGSILRVKLKERKQFFTSESKKKSCTLWHFSFDTRFNSLSNSSRKVQFFESFLGNSGSILWVIFQKSGSIFRVNQKKIILRVMLKRRAQYCESRWKEGFTSVSEKKGSILWVFFVSKKINSVSHVFEKVQFFESFFGKNLLFESYWSKKKFNSSHVKKVIHMEGRFNSLSILKKV